MNNLNIPLFRAEIIEDKRDEDYKKGFTIEVNNVKYAIGNYTKGLIEVEVDGQTRFFPIKKNTLAINFNNMLDSQGNKIFASLSEDGKGGDIIKYEIYSMHMKYKKIEPSIKTSICIFTSKGFNMMVSLLSNDYYGIKIIGIRK